MGEKGLESPVAGTGTGAPSGFTVASALPAGLGSAVDLASGGSPVAPDVAAALPGLAADVSLAPDTTSSSEALLPPKG